MYICSIPVDLKNLSSFNKTILYGKKYFKVQVFHVLIRLSEYYFVYHQKFKKFLLINLLMYWRKRIISSISISGHAELVLNTAY